MHIPRYTLTLLATALVVVLSSPLTVVHAAARQSSTIAQGFQADKNSGKIVSGALVAMNKGSSRTVSLATTENSSQLLGVVDASPLVTISQNKKEVEVVLNGSTTALVSDINGVVAVGDKIAPSPIAGVGMKATTTSQVVGTSTAVATGGKKLMISDKEGVKHSVTISRVSLQVNVARYQAPGNDLVPTFAQNLADDIADKQVTVMRVLVATLLLLAGFASMLIIVFGSVRSAIISIGRNPLAQKDIRRGLYQVLLLAVVIAASSVLASYLVIRL